MKTEMLKKFPKIELHCHLDGSLSERALRRILAEAADDCEMLMNKIQVKGNAVDLADYLSCFDFILPFLQSAASLQIAAYELLREAAAEQVIYIEVRFAPMLHCRKGLRQREAVQAVWAGLELGQRDFGVMSRLILCMMRGKADAQNEETLFCAMEMHGHGVAGLDLAGNEAAYPPEIYHELFRKACSWRIPFTIHAGECGSAGNVRTAILMGASRIGHGVAIADNEEVKNLCRSEGVTLEMCPISNLQTGAVKTMESYPFVRMQSEGIAVTVNTDNRMVSDTSLVKEWSFINQYFKEAGRHSLWQAGYQAMEAAFLPASERTELKQIFSKKIREWDINE